MKSLTTILFPLGCFALASCASHFSAAHSEAITPRRFVEICRIDPLDQMFYYGSDSTYHYFYRGRLVGSGSFKIRKNDFRLPEEFSLTEGRKPLFLVGHFDEKTACWIQKEGFR
jgi:hypothetical protein